MSVLKTGCGCSIRVLLQSLTIRALIHVCFDLVVVVSTYTGALTGIEYASV